ncbi:MAG: transposase [Terriglobia bacterium]
MESQEQVSHSFHRPWKSATAADFHIPTATTAVFIFLQGRKKPLRTHNVPRWAKLNRRTGPKEVAKRKSRWRVELFFKWIKQHLRIKAFYGTSDNAVKTQVWTAVSIYVLVAILKKRLNLGLSLYTILQILSVSLFEKMPISEVLTDNDLQNWNTRSDNQLTLFEL